MVRANFHIDYYEDKPKYEAGAKPKGTMVLDGYEVVTDPNARKMDFKKKINAKLNIEEEVGEYTKYEPLTIECYHATRRRWLVKCKDQADFDSWVAALKEAAVRSSARTLTDPVRVEAFDAAFDTMWRELIKIPIEIVRCGIAEGRCFRHSLVALCAFYLFRGLLRCFCHPPSFVLLLHASTSL